MTKKLNRKRVHRLYRAVQQPVHGAGESVRSRKTTPVQSCTEDSAVQSGTPVYTKTPVFELSEAEGREEARRNRNKWELLAPIAAGAMSVCAACVLHLTEASMILSAGAAVLAGAAIADTGHKTRSHKISRKARCIFGASAGAVALALLIPPTNAACIAGTVVLIGAAAGAVGIAANCNLVWRNREVTAQGKTTNAAINQMVYGGEHEALKAWTEGGHERTALSCRQALRNHIGEEVAVHETTVATVGKDGYLQGYEDCKDALIGAVDAAKGTYDTEIARRDGIIKKAMKLAGAVVELETIPEDETECMAAYVKELVKIAASDRSQKDEEDRLREEYKSTLLELSRMRKEAESWHRMYTRLYDRTEEVMDQLHQLPDEEDEPEAAHEEDTAAPRENVIHLVTTPEATPEAVWSARDLEGLSWGQIASRFGLKSRSSAQNLYNKHVAAIEAASGEEVAQNG